jgi:hypothetical protein
MGFAYPGSDKFKFVDLNLGSDKRHDNPSDDYYWEAVRDAIIKPALEASYYHHRTTDKILLHGDHFTDERFQKVISEVVEMALENTPEILNWIQLFLPQEARLRWRKRCIGNIIRPLRYRNC